MAYAVSRVGFAGYSGVLVPCRSDSSPARQQNGGYVGGRASFPMESAPQDAPLPPEPAPTVGRVRIDRQCVATEESLTSPCASGQCHQDARLQGGNFPVAPGGGAFAQEP
jgi:hypothetical protein